MSNHPRDTVAHNSQAAVDFLAKLGNECPLLSVKTVDVATGEVTGFNTTAFPGFLQQDSIVARAVALVEKNQGNGDIYYALNPTKDTGNKKAERTDVISLDCVHVDLDPRVDEDQDAARERLTAKLRAFRLKPTFIIASGGGVQAIWRIKPEERIQINGDLAVAEEAKLHNIQLERELDGDNCHNIDRILRLPDTINCPDKKKRAKGRHYAPAYVIEYNPDAVVSLADVGKAKVAAADTKPTGAHAGKRASSSSAPVVAGPRIINLDDVPSLAALKPWVKAVIHDGEDKTGEKKWPKSDTDSTHDRSKMVFAICCEMARGDVDDATMAALLTDDTTTEMLSDGTFTKTFKFNQTVVDKKGSAQVREVERYISRAREAVKDPDLEEMNGKHAVVDHGGKVFILSWKPSETDETVLTPRLHGQRPLRAEVFQPPQGG